MDIAVAYCRVSTKNQNEALQDHQDQWEDIFDKIGYVFANCGVFYKKDGYKEPKKGLYVDEGISAKEYKKHRKAFLQMIKDAKDGKFKQIFVEDTTRFARSIEDGIGVIRDLREHGVNVHFRKEGLDSIEPSNDMVFGVLFSVAENEIRTDSNRFKWKQERLANAGKWSAPAPYGYTVSKSVLSINEEEMPIVDLIFYLYTERLLGMRNIANYLNHMNLKGNRTRKGKLWKATEISYILHNQIYKGDIVSHKTESVDITRGTTRKIPESEQIVRHKEYLRIIDDETWERKNLILEQRNEKLKDRKGYSTTHLLSTLLYCEQCGSTYIRVKKKKTNDETNTKVDRGYEWTCLGHNHYGEIKCKGRYGLEENELIEFIKQELKQEQTRDRKQYLDVYIEKKGLELENIDIDKLIERREELHRQIIELRAEKHLMTKQNYEENLKFMNDELDQIRISEKRYNNIKIDIERAEARYKLRCDILNNLNFNKLDNVALKQLFSQIKIMGEYKDGYKDIYIHFGYNFIDDTITELGREFDDIEHSAFEYYKPYQRQKIRKSTKTRYFNDK